MCHSCWDERLEANPDTVPAPVTAGMKDAVAWLYVLYQHHGAGGALHVYVDDWNLPVPADLPDYLEGTVLDTVEQRCWDALGCLSEDQQATALAIFDGHYRAAPDVSPLTMRMGFWGAEKFWSDEVETLYYAAKCGICGEYKTFQQDPKIFDRHSSSCSACLRAGKRPVQL